MTMVLSRLKGLKNWQLAVLSGLIMSLGWPPLPTFFVLFLGLLPLFILEEKTSQQKTIYFLGWLYLAHFIWNLIVTWWVYKASLGGAIFMVIANSFLQTIPWLLYRYSKKLVSPQKALLLFACYYLAFEYIHHVWDLSWPWLTLGNALAAARPFAQFYEFTGTAGGSIWILLVNILFFQWYRGKLKIMAPLTGIVLPAAISLLMYFAIDYKNGDAVKVGIVQPNFEPHEEKFSIPPMVQLDTMLGQMNKLAAQGATLFILPETALVDYITEDYAMQNEKMVALQNFIKAHPSSAVLAGCETIVEYDQRETPTAREYMDAKGYFYDSYNTAIYMDSRGLQPFYHKTKLVPGTEIMPYPAVFAFLGKYAIALGGTSGSLGRDYKVVNFHTQSQHVIAPNICYESIHGAWTGKFVNEGSELIATISNDGWWGQTYGHKQLLQYGALRAIETRKWIARSGNTGISAIIDPKGNISQETKFWTRDAISATVYYRKGKTLYVILGDYLGKIALLISLFILPSLWVKKVITSNTLNVNTRK